MSTSPPPPQTTLLIGGSNGTATLCAILGDRSNPHNANHTLRVATRSAGTYLNDDGSSPRVWRCGEKKHLSDLVSADFLPTRMLTHVGAPNSVFVYGGAGDDGGVRGGGVGSMSQIERAISGVSAPDDGGVADVIILACPVSAHLSLLRRVARALYNLDAAGLLGSSNRPPILVGTLYGAGGFDWQSRIAFYSERPDGFVKWKRPLGLFALKAFPYLCKSLKPGEVTLHGRFPQLQVAVSPSNAYTRRHAGMILDRVLQTATTGKSLEFLGLCADEKLGGDGAVLEEAAVLTKVGYGGSYPGRAIETAANARNAIMIAAHTHKQLKQAKEGVSGSAAASVAATLSHPTAMLPASTNVGPDGLPANMNAMPNPRALDVLLTQSLSDHADPKSSLGFLTCTLNSTNQILHPCILVALFGGDGKVDPDNAENDDGTIYWNPTKELTSLPRFYADGAAKPLAGELITAIAGGEMYFVIDALERLLSPRGYDPITALHGGEPIGRRVMNWLGNSPHDLGERSGLTGAALRREWRGTFGGDGDCEGGGEFGNATGLINREKLLAKLMSYGLSHNSRLGAVLSPCLIDESYVNSEDGTIRIRPNPATRFFTDDVQHGLCIYLGLAELLGFDLERDMKTTLYVVRRLQRWMKKEFVLPRGGNECKNGNQRRLIVGSARDLAETSAPQSFGVHSVQELKQFLRLDLFGERHQATAEDRLMGSELVSRL
ncbi:hypothetical protein ACHAXA_004423 [Cyclostephanos tholiformis]|uniref:Opine dehydrogenase domain-containing protein n=1 Tax=Cyclostephanos tholiformis TaxID=382380 RepID=A0ABD3R128_9STRA